MPYIEKKYFREDYETIFKNMISLDTSDVFKVNNALIKNGYKTFSIEEKRNLLEEELKEYLLKKIIGVRKFITKWELRNLNILELMALYHNIFLEYSKIDNFCLKLCNQYIDNVTDFLLQRFCELQDKLYGLTWINDETDEKYERHPKLCIRKNVLILNTGYQKDEDKYSRNDVLVYITHEKTTSLEAFYYMWYYFLNNISVKDNDEELRRLREPILSHMR